MSAFMKSYVGAPRPQDGTAQGSLRSQRKRLPTWRAAEGAAAGRRGAPMGQSSAGGQQCASNIALASLVAPTGAISATVWLMAVRSL